MRLLPVVCLALAAQVGCDSIDPHYVDVFAPEESEDETTTQPLSHKNSQTFNFIDMLTNPVALFKVPPYDVTENSRDMHVHVSYCSS
jgi:hypothetical protein